MPDHDPKWDRLMPDNQGDWRLPPPAPALREIAYSVGVPGREKDEYTYVFRFFNKYRWERVVARDQENIMREEATGNVVPGNQGTQYRQTTYLRRAYVLFQKYELL